MDQYHSSQVQQTPLTVLQEEDTSGRRQSVGACKATKQGAHPPLVSTSSGGIAPSGHVGTQESV